MPTPHPLNRPIPHTMAAQSLMTAKAWSDLNDKALRIKRRFMGM